MVPFQPFRVGLRRQQRHQVQVSKLLVPPHRKPPRLPPSPKPFPPSHRVRWQPTTSVLLETRKFSSAKCPTNMERLCWPILRPSSYFAAATTFSSKPGLISSF